MKSWPAVSITIAFIAIAAFGFLAMGYNHGCIAETATQATCPAGNIFEAANFLLNAFKSFSSAHLFSSFIATFFMLLLGGLFFVIPRLRQKNHEADLLSRRQNFAVRSVPAKIEFINWLALLEKRDPAFSF